MRCFTAAFALLFSATVLIAEEIGSVSTVFKLLGPNDKIVIEAFDDPKVDGVTCHLSRAKKGGVTGAVGLATDTSDAAIASPPSRPHHHQGRTERRRASVFSTNARRSCSRRCKWFGFWIKHVMCWSTSSTATS